MLTGRKVLVTGGARGLGEAFARALLAAGARVVIADVLHERGAALATELGDQVHYVAMDISDPAAITLGVDAAARHLGGLDGLINNAAITNSGGKTMSEVTVDTWDRVMNVNVRGTWLTTVAAQPYLAASGNGRVVNLSPRTVADPNLGFFLFLGQGKIFDIPVMIFVFLAVVLVSFLVYSKTIFPQNLEALALMAMLLLGVRWQRSGSAGLAFHAWPYCDPTKPAPL